ncbi:hypothetical protein MNB_SV-6-1463 [hydrothermal vent metagenome]|uniref:Uncharacterized protein n=1 Tax=hydrothermal vent metagenome TaxID=652676 RepID=A0A1W1BCG1_9ZZZZ
MSNISISQKRLFLTLLLLLYTSVYAREAPPIGISNLQISLGINDYKSRAIDVITKVKDDKKIIYASGWIEHAPKDTIVTFKWYREMPNGDRYLLVKPTIKVTGSRFIYSRIVFDKKSTTKAGRYGVAVVVDDKVLASSSFEIVSSDPTVTKKSCTTFDNEVVKGYITKLLDRYPKVKREKSLNFGLYSDPKNGIIFYLQNGWYPMANSSGTIIYLSQKEKNIINKYMVRKIERFWSEDDIKDPEEFIYYSAKAIGDLSIESAKKSGERAEYAGDISIFHFDSYIVAHLVVHLNGKIDRYKSITLLWSGRELYALEITTRESDLQLGEFLSSLWYMTFCDKSSKIIKAEDIPLSKCLKPDIKSDEKLIEDLFESNRDIEKIAIDYGLKFKRYIDAQEGFSIIAPDGWKVVPATDEAIFNIKHLDKNGIYQDMMIHKISIDKKKMEAYTPKQLLEKFYKFMSTSKDGESVELTKKLKTLDIKNRLLGTFRTKEIVGGIESFQFYAMVLKDDKLYIITTIVDKANYNLGKLLSTIGIYTFVTREICGG